MDTDVYETKRITLEVVSEHGKCVPQRPAHAQLQVAARHPEAILDTVNPSLRVASFSPVPYAGNPLLILLHSGMNSSIMR